MATEKMSFWPKPPPGDGGPAFPQQSGVGCDGTWKIDSSEGMTLRDYFAAKAMAAIIHAATLRDDGIGRRLLRLCFGKRVAVWWSTPHPDQIATRSYMHADGMLVARVPE